MLETVTDRREASPWRVLLGGILGLVVAMGIGRFAYTPILPTMQRDTGLGPLMAGQIASWNYVGYLAGTVLLFVFVPLRRSRALCPTSLAVSCATTVAMGLTSSPIWWSVLRFVGGMASSIAFVSVAGLVISHLSRSGRSSQSPLVFSGVGFGIACTGALTPLLDTLYGWRGGWFGLGAVSAILSMTSWKLLAEIPPGSSSTATVTSARSGIGLLTAAYFLEGLGYIVTATFLVAIVTHTPGMAGWGAASWITVGLSAAPSTALWQLISRRFGWRLATTAAYLLQAASLFLSKMADGPIGILLSAAAFGGTFVGITALSMAEGASRSGVNQSRSAIIMTAAFALGQVLGPICAGWLAQGGGGFGLSLELAGVCVLTGGALTWLDRPAIRVVPLTDEATTFST